MTKKQQVSSKVKPKKELKIDLDTLTKLPRKELIDVYQKNDAMSIWTDYDIKPEYQNNRAVWAASKGSGKPVKKSIFAVYRRKLASGREVGFMYCQITARDFFNNVITQLSKLSGLKNLYLPGIILSTRT